jgi:hypothetical protein
MANRAIFLPFATVDDIRADLADTQQRLDRLDDRPAVSVERREELRLILLRGRDRLLGQLAEMEAEAYPPDPLDIRAVSRKLDLELALQSVAADLAEIEGKLRADIIRCCDGRAEFCESYGCSTIEDIANRLQAIRREAISVRDERVQESS